MCSREGIFGKFLQEQQWQAPFLSLTSLPGNRDACCRTNTLYLLVNNAPLQTRPLKPDLGCTWPSRTLLTPHTPAPVFSCGTHPLQYTFGQSPSKVVHLAWHCANSPVRGQHHPKATPAPGRGEGNQHARTTAAVAPAVGWRQTSGLTASPTHQHELLRG